MIRAKKSLGQHFLVDKNIARNIIKAADPQPGDSILEIGPGTGVLTALLAYSPGHTVALDIDRRAVEVLLSRAGTEGWKNISILHGDILKFDIGSVSPGTRLKVIGNLPYNITSPILFRLFECQEAISSAVCMMQFEVARRICSGPGTKDYGILSVVCQAYATPVLLFKVSPNVFVPKPDVWSAVVRFDFMKNRLDRIPSREGFKRVVKAAFGVRRKTLLNALRRGGVLPEYPPQEIASYLGKRAEQLSVDDFITLTSYLELDEQ